MDHAPLHRDRLDEAGDQDGDDRARQPRPVEPEPLLRDRVGDALRSERTEQGLRLVDVAERAGVSPQYLSEVERGTKDPSSEVLAAVAGALGLALDDLLTRVLEQSSVPTATILTGPRLLVLPTQTAPGLGSTDAQFRLLAA